MAGTGPDGDGTGTRERFDGPEPVPELFDAERVRPVHGRVLHPRRGSRRAGGDRRVSLAFAAGGHAGRDDLRFCDGDAADTDGCTEFTGRYCRQYRTLLCQSGTDREQGDPAAEQDGDDLFHGKGSAERQE